MRAVAFVEAVATLLPTLCGKFLMRLAEAVCGVG
jgi:hypothetical protein